MITLIRCQNCGRSFEAEAELLGATGECPHCHQTTALQADNRRRPPIPTKRPRRLIEDKLERTGVSVLLGGWVGAAVLMIDNVILPLADNQDFNSGMVWDVISCICLVGLGSVICELFYALAEIIRLLRK